MEIGATFLIRKDPKPLGAEREKGFGSGMLSAALFRGQKFSDELKSS